MGPDGSLRLQVAQACRILARWGHNDLILGHVSARDEGGVIYMKPNDLGMDEVAPSDVLTLDSDGKRLSGALPVHSEVVLHTEVYRSRPDVGAVVHTHSPYATALGATEAPLAVLNHDGAIFKNGIAVFDDTPEVLTTPEQGAAVAQTLGQGTVVLLRNHGVLVAGRNVPAAVYALLQLERAIQIQAIASSLGPLRPVAPEHLDALFASRDRPGVAEKFWPYLVRQISGEIP